MIGTIKGTLHQAQTLTKLFQYADNYSFAYNLTLENERTINTEFLQDGELRKEFTQLKKQR